ncbi:TraU family protein [Alteromonas macleodii]|uniref:TraU family protein n=1 Tax=Alteromonas macleodii TaxID=28108 RepID=A0AB36FLA0_ALTMA|nr:TraU family protein [Alteromonas macleodii]OES24221.1 traU family protein [Alteromonas macleodii]OES24852.1 traU family protein [Alteromonas macleodii]OES25130.1 traU family protein [Alteromonas macleodii]OES39172.1 traU family protein [Alteromonas macleodii]
MRFRLVTLVFLLLLSSRANATCNGTFLNPITDIAWENIFPISIGGVIEIGKDSKYSHGIGAPICTCSRALIPMIGIKVAMWEPARIIDTVKDPFCMMPFGSVIAPAGNLTVKGAGSRDTRDSNQFNQFHWYIFPALALLDLFVDLPCVDYQREFDVAMMTELLLTWNNDQYSTIINPEALLVANPVAQLACMADATSVMFRRPIDQLFWCIGNHSVYPIAGTVDSADPVEAHMANAAKAIFQMGRLGLLWQYRSDGCGLTPSIMWSKSRWRLQLSKPVRSSEARYPGVPGVIWTPLKHPPLDDNFMTIVFRKLDCCVGN